MSGADGRRETTARVTPETLRSRGVAPAAGAGPEVDVPFDDLVYQLAEGVAAAQSKLDLTLAESVRAFAETTVDVTPRLVRTVDADGGVSTAADEPVERSLLELGLTPTRYQFSEATVDAEFDLSLSEEGAEERENGGGFGLRAGTADLREYRKYDRDVTATATLSATLVPTPLPPFVEPDTVIETDSGGEDAG